MSEEEVCATFGVSRSWIKEHAKRLGNFTRPRKFIRSVVEAYFTDQSIKMSKRMSHKQDVAKLFELARCNVLGVRQ